MTLILIGILFIQIFIVVAIYVKYLILKISQIKCSKTEIGKSINIIVSFLYENEIKFFFYRHNIKDYYLFFNKLNISNSMKICIITPKGMKTFHEQCIDELISEVSIHYYRNTTDDLNWQMIDKEQLKQVYEDSVTYRAYKERYLLEGWLLQVIKANKYAISQQLYESYALIKNEIERIKNDELNLQNKEKKKLFKAFQDENDKFNNLIKNIYS